MLAGKITFERSKAIASLFVAMTNCQPIWQAEQDIARFLLENLAEPVFVEETQGKIK